MRFEYEGSSYGADDMMIGRIIVLALEKRKKDLALEAARF